MARTPGTHFDTHIYENEPLPRVDPISAPRKPKRGGVLAIVAEPIALTVALARPHTRSITRRSLGAVLALLAAPAVLIGCLPLQESHPLLLSPTSPADHTGTERVAGEPVALGRGGIDIANASDSMTVKTNQI